MAVHRFIPTLFHNVIGTKPTALSIADGDTVVTRTIDAAGFDEEGVQRASGPNPMNGPISVEDAEPGDALKVEILEMTPTRDSGFTRNILAANVLDPEAIRELPPSAKANWTIDREALTARLSEPITGLEAFVLPLAL
ncbi:acetamidase/formamidase family protein [Rhizobium sp. BK251]|nr:acetamidase/formamidase family protein [Rhizobium sp. BK251]